MKQFSLLLALSLLAVPLSAGADGSVARPRVIVSTDVGGTDFDDYQSLVHLFVYADRFDLEGLISSPMGAAGRKKEIDRVVDLYAQDYAQLRSFSPDYPSPGALRSIVKQGEIQTAPYAGVRSATEGSEWIVRCARRDDPRPLHLLLWGGIEDLAQALHDAPDILPKLRVYYIGGPNKKWSPDAYHYVATQHPKLWMIESNTTYYGWFVGGEQTGDLGAENFAAAHAVGRGALGEFFARGISFEGRQRTALKMGDTPSVAWLLHGDPARPSEPGWGGRYVRAWPRPAVRFERLTTAADSVERCGIFELVLPVGATVSANAEARMEIENQKLVGHFDVAGAVHFRFCPKEAKLYRYTVRSTVAEIDGLKGELTARPFAPASALTPDAERPNWWTDDPAPTLKEGQYDGARTINVWRADYLRDFAARLERCRISIRPAS